MPILSIFVGYIAFIRTICFKGISAAQDIVVTIHSFLPVFLTPALKCQWPYRFFLLQVNLEVPNMIKAWSSVLIVQLIHPSWDALLCNRGEAKVKQSRCANLSKHHSTEAFSWKTPTKHCIWDMAVDHMSSGWLYPHIWTGWISKILKIIWYSAWLVKIIL